MTGRTASLWQRLGVLLCVVLLLGVMPGCEKSSREKLLKAKTNLEKQKNLDETETLINEVLESEPDHMEAKRLLAEVYQTREDFRLAEEQLDKLWKLHNFEKGAADRSSKLKNVRELVRTQFVELYKTWAESLDPEAEPEKFVEVVRRGLAYDEKDMDLNSILVDYYWKKGQRLVDETKKKQAAEAFEKIQSLRTRRGDDRRKKAKKRARDLRVEFFEDEGRKRFEESGREVIAGIDGLTLNESGDTIVIDVVQEVDRNLEPDNEEDAAKAKQMAFIGLVDKLRKVMLPIADLPEDADLRKIGSERAKRILLSKLEFDETSFRRGQYTIKGELSVEQAIGMAYDIKTAYEEADKGEQQQNDDGEPEGQEGSAGGNDTTDRESDE